MRTPMNPFLVALVVIGIVATFAALVLGLIGSNSSDPGVVAGAAAWGGVVTQIAILSVIGALVAAAVTWRPRAEPTAESSSSGVASVPADPSALTDAERRFFGGDAS